MIDISLVTFNSSKWLSSFFLSLENQDFSLDQIHLVICDNSSQDSTFQLLKEYQEKSLKNFASIQIFKHPNRGFGSGHNFNCTKTYSPFILVTNVDLEFEKSSIQKIVSLAAQDGQEYASWEFRQKPFEHPKYYNPITLETSWSSHACVLFRREAFEKVGGYEEKIFMYGEDVELSYRLRSHGYKLRYCPSSACWHYSYQYANQIKSLQFFGSILANSYIRIRYGTIRNILAIPQMYLSLFKGQQPFPRYRWQLILNLLKILFNFIYFFQTRPKIKNPTQFPIRKWDYEIIREGAFYEFKPYDESSDLPLVSVITRSYSGRLPYLKECLQSIENQTYRNIESIVVEDGSETSKHYVESLSNSSFDVTYKYFSVPKKGRSYAGNFGLSQATGQFLIFLDDDDLFFADHLEVLVYELVHNTQYSAVYSIAWEVPTEVVSTNPLSYIEKSHNVINKQIFSKAILWHHNFIPIQTILFHRSLYDHNGGFDENLEYLEDWDLWIRYSACNNFLLIGKLTSLYRVPWHRQIQLDREKNMLKAYKSVVQKQSLIKLETTPYEIISLAYAFQVLQQQADLHYYLKCLDTSDSLPETIMNTTHMVSEHLRQPLTSRYKLLNIIKQKHPASWEALRHFLYTIRLIN